MVNVLWFKPRQSGMLAYGHAAIRIKNANGDEIAYINWVGSRFLPGQTFHTEIGQVLNAKRFGVTQGYQSELNLYDPTVFEVKKSKIASLDEKPHGLNVQSIITWWRMFLNEGGLKTIGYDYGSKHYDVANARDQHKYNLKYKACSTVAMIALLHGGAEKYAGTHSNFKSFLKLFSQNLASKLAHTMVTPEHVFNYAEKIRTKVEFLNTNHEAQKAKFKSQPKTFPDATQNPADYHLGIWTAAAFLKYSGGTHVYSHRYQLLKDMDTDLRQLHADLDAVKPRELISADIDDLLDLIHRFSINRIESNRKDAVFTLGKQLMAKRDELFQAEQQEQLLSAARQKQELDELQDLREEVESLYQSLSGFDLPNVLALSITMKGSSFGYDEREIAAFIQRAKGLYYQETSNIATWDNLWIHADKATLIMIRSELKAIETRASAAVEEFINTGIVRKPPAAAQPPAQLPPKPNIPDMEGFEEIPF